MRKYIFFIVIVILLKIILSLNFYDIGYYTNDIKFIKNKNKIKLLKINKEINNIKSVYRFPGHLDALVIKTNSKEFIYYFNSSEMLQDTDSNDFDYPLIKKI